MKIVCDQQLCRTICLRATAGWETRVHQGELLTESEFKGEGMRTLGGRVNAIFSVLMVFVLK